MNFKYDFSNKNVVITGGARGIGLEIVRRFLESGAQVSVWDFSTEALEAARAELKSFGSRVQFQQVDVSKLVSCEAAANSAKELDILVNNAGITRDKTLAKMTAEDFDQVIATNLSGVFNVTKSLLPKFRSEASSAKRIVNIASVVAHNGNFGQTNYVAAKAGVIGMTKTWSKELGRKGFTSNAIAPGFTHTAMVEAMPAEVRAGMAEKIPAGRLGQTQDIANACLFLASEEAGYINGAVLNVDGGLIV